MAVIRKITNVKERIKKVADKKKTGKARSVTLKSRGPKVTPSANRLKKEFLGTEELTIENAKFSHPEVPKILRRSMPHELPGAYGRDKIVLQVRDPWWLHSYWEITEPTWNRLRDQLKDSFYSARKVLRVYDVTNIMFNGNNANRFFDIEVNPVSASWYIDTAGPGRSWCVDFGLKLADGRFITIVRSNVVQTPSEGPSWITDEEWMIPDEMFGRLYGLGFGFGQSSPTKAWQDRFKKALFSGVLASPGMSSAGSPVKKQLARERKFWMVVDCELIVYGATEPDATVYVQGKQIKLRPDGTFTLRYYLPDSKQVIPVKGISADGEEERTITPIVTRETR